MYADEVKLCIQGKSSSAPCNLQSDLDHFEKWCSDNDLIVMDGTQPATYSLFSFLKEIFLRTSLNIKVILNYNVILKNVIQHKILTYKMTEKIGTPIFSVQSTPMSNVLCPVLL